MFETDLTIINSGRASVVSQLYKLRQFADETKIPDIIFPGIASEEYFDDRLEHDHEMLIPYKDRFSRGFEVPLAISHEERDYPFRMIILFDHGVAAKKRHGLENSVGNTKAAFDELGGKLNKYRLRTEESIDRACLAILKNTGAPSFLNIRFGTIRSRRTRTKSEAGPA